VPTRKRRANTLALLHSTALADEVLGDAKKGAKHYEMICAACHGAEGNGKGPASGALKPPPRDFTDAELMETLSDEHLIEVISKGGAAVGRSPLMPPWEGALKAKEIRDVAAYIRSFAPVEESRE